MKSLRRTSLVTLIAAAAILSFAFLMAQPVHAADPAVIPSGSTVTATDANTNMFGNSYISEPVKGVKTYNVQMPKDGCLALMYFYSGAASVNVTNAAGSRISYTNSATQAITGQDGTSVTAYVHYYNLAKGSYKIQVETYTNGQYAVFSPTYAPASGTLKSGKLFIGGAKSATGKAVYKINVKKNGYLNLKVTDSGGTTNYPQYTVQLLNKKKKAITKPETLYSSVQWNTTFGVKKGTYYIAVTSNFSSPCFDIKATAKAVKVSKYGKSKKKAVTLKAKKTAKGVLFAAKKKTTGKQWFKFTLKKDKAVKVTVKTKCSPGSSKGKLQVVIMNNYSKSTNRFDNNVSTQTTGGTISLYTIGNGNKLKKGTYWICVSGENYGNGYYTLKWK